MKRWPSSLLFVVFLIVGCSRDERPLERTVVTPPPAVSDDTPQDGGTLVRRLEADIHSLNPVLASTKYESHVQNYIFTPLINVDANLNVIAGLAESWEVSPDGKRYTFKLNEKATFSDGKPVRAGDVLFTLRKIVDPAAQSVQFAGNFELFDSASSRVVDEHTVEVAFREPLASQLIRFNQLFVLPEHVYGRGDFAKDHNAIAVGSGPYKLVRFTSGTEIVLERRPDYWGTRPHIQSVVFKVITDHATAWNAVQRGDVDETILQSDTWVREHNNRALQTKLEFQRFYMRMYNYVAWNNRNALLSDKRVRRALGMCMPTESVINNLFHGTARAMSGPFTPDEWAYNPTVPVVRYDPVEAKRILASVGWLDTNGDGVLDKGGKPFRLTMLVLSRSGTTMQFAQLLQGELKKIGVQMEINVSDAAVAFERILAGNYEAAYLAWELDPDPDVFALFHSKARPPASGQNFVFYSNPEVDQLIDAGRRELDQSKRKDIYHRVHTILAEDQPYLWVVQVSTKWAVNRRVKGVKVSPAFGPYLWYPGELGWWLAK